MSENSLSLEVILREKDAEIEYLRTRNLSLSQALQNLAEQVKDLQDKVEERDALIGGEPPPKKNKKNK